MSDPITFTENTLDSRDILARLEELRTERADLVAAISDAGHPEDPGEDYNVAAAVTCAENDLREWDDENAEELKRLESIEDECSSDGETWIADSYFQTYAEELAGDIGAINSDARWPSNCIDWERAARELQMDYTCVEIDGNAYWYRA